MVLAAISLLMATACKKSGNSADSPLLPPAVSLEMDGLTNFVSLTKSETAAPDSSHFKMAWRLVHSWDSISTKLVLTPKLLLKEALKGKNAAYDAASRQWSWTFIKAIPGDGSYQAILTAKKDEDSLFWAMTVSRINGDGLYNFKWMEGRTDIQQTGGWWTLYDPVSSFAYLSIAWNKTSDTEHWIQYTNIIDGDPGKGSYIKYGTTNAVDFNAYFTIFIAASGKTAQIEWNTTTRVGQLSYDGAIYAWDSSMKNK